MLGAEVSLFVGKCTKTKARANLQERAKGIVYTFLAIVSMGYTKAYPLRNVATFQIENLKVAKELPFFG